MKTANIIPIKKKQTQYDAPFLDSFLEKGVVVSIVDHVYMVSMGGTTVKAKRAIGCIIDPVIDDVVLICNLGNSEYYILFVLEKNNNMEPSITFNANLNITTRNITVKSYNNMTLSSDNINIISNKNIQKADDAIISFKSLKSTGIEAIVSFKNIRIISNIISTMAKNAIKTFISYIRRSKETDIVESHTMERRSKGLYSLNSEYSIMLSKKDTKIDGEHVHIG
jgi:hypothetical protein